jgi:hypothetical protein
MPVCAVAMAAVAPATAAMCTICTRKGIQIDCYTAPNPRIYRALVDIVLNYDSDATQLGSDEDSATQYESEAWESYV